MTYLIKDALILDKGSPYYQKTVDIAVENGVIIEISSNISSSNHTLITGKRLVLSTAFVDIHAQSGEPQDLESETLHSFIESATAGGFAYVSHVPNDRKLTQTKSDIIFLQSENARSICQVLPYGNVTRTNDSKVLSAMMDMNEAGAVAFYDGNTNPLSLSVLKNALLYTKGFGGKVIVHPEKKELSKNGQVNQGKMSVSLGYKGIPSEAEFMAVQEIVDIASYVDAEILIMNITTEESIDAIVKANKKSKQIFTAVSSTHLLFEESMLQDYDTNYKLNPPLRSSTTKKAIVHAVLKGKIDMVCSQHTPCTTEEKCLEFDLASTGIINLQTSFLACLEALGEEHIEKCIELFSTNPAQYLGIPFPSVDIQTKGSFTLVDLEDEFELTAENNRSKSQNSPFFGRKMKGKIKGLISNGREIFY